MDVRMGKKEDLPIIKEWLRESWLAHVDHEPELVNRDVMEKTDLKNYFKDCFNGSEKSFVLIAQEENRMAGVLKVNIEKIQRFFNQHKVLYLDDIYVLPEFRGRGVSEMLILEAEKLAQKKKIKWLKARVYEFNIPEQKVMGKNGFKKVYGEYFKILG
jgi:GNAT superfamily N-acetyltransferase